MKVIWAKDGGSGTPWGPTIIFSEKKSASLNSVTLELKGEVFFQSHLWILPLLQIVSAGGNFDVSVSLVSLYECPPCYSDQHPIQKIGRKGDI